MENPFTHERFRKYFLPKPQSIIEFDLTRQEYVSWIGKALIKFDTRWGKDGEVDKRPLLIEKRFLVGYEQDAEEEILIIHALGSKGLDKKLVNTDDEINLFVIRRPVFGAVVVLCLLTCAITTIGIDWVFKKFGRKPPFDI